MSQEIIFNTTEFLLFITAIVLVFLSILFATFLFTIQSKNKIGNTLLGIFLIIRAIDISSIFYPYYIELPTIVEMLRHNICGLVAPPLLYLFVLSIVYSDFKLKKKNLLHLIPFIISTIILMPRFYLPLISGDSISYTKEVELNSIYWIASLQQIGYIIAVFFLLFRYRKLLLENYSILEKYNYRWLFHMNVIVVIIFLIASSKNIYKFVFGNDYGYSDELRLIVTISMLLFTCWLMLKALYAPRLFVGIDSKLQLVSDLTKYNENLSLESDKVSQLKAHVKNSESFLNPTLTIKELAKDIGMSTTELSLLINKHLKQNFYEFIGSFRIEKAKKVLKNPEYKKLTILEILYQVGFNTKSSFNTSFKKQTGLTPTQYRKKHL